MATYKVGADGKAQSGLQAGDEVVTAGGTYKITGVNADGTYQSTLTNKNQTTNNYTGGYASSSGSSAGKTNTVTSTGTSKTNTSSAVPDTTDGTVKVANKDVYADTSRNTEYAGQTVYKNGYAITYNDLGYVTKAVRSESPSYAGHTDLNVEKNGVTTDKTMWTDEQLLTAEDQAAINALRAQGAAGTISWAEANAQANAIRAKYGYTITQDGTVVDQQAVDRATQAQQNTGATSYYDKDTGTYKPIVSAPATNVGTVTEIITPSVTTPTTGGAAASGTTTPQVNLPDLPGLSLNGVEIPEYSGSVALPELGGTVAMPEYDLSGLAVPQLGGGTVALPEYDLSGLSTPQLGGGDIAVPELGSTQVQAPAFETGEVAVNSVPQYEVGDYSQYIKDLYAANVEAELAALEDAYKTNVGTLESAGERIGQTYQAAQNAAAAQNAVAKRNMQETMAASGLNTGTSGQMTLAQSAALQSQLGTLSVQEAQAVTENQRERDELARQYQSAIVQAKANGNSALAAALYEEMVRQDSAKQSASQAAQEQANWEAQFALSQQQSRNELLQQQYANAVSQQQYADSIAQQNYENQMAQQQYRDNLTIQQYQQELALQQYKDQLAQQGFENAFSQQQYADSMALQQYQQELALQQYKDQLAQQGYENAFSQQQYKDSIAQQQYQNEVAQQQYADQLLQQQYENAFAQQQYKNQLAQQEYENLFGQQQYRDQQTQQSFENDLLLRQYEDALAQQAYENALAAKKGTSSGSSGSAGSSGGGSMSLTTAKAMMKAGQFTDEAVNVMLKAGFNEEYLRSEYGYGAAKVPVTPPSYSEVAQNSTAGDYGPQFNMVMSKLQIQQQSGADLETLAAEIMTGLEEGKLTTAGAASLMQALGI